ncbi:MAG: tetratricopeptide repeat protein [bacterium]|nr:tetratricopeptide repeat protein [bacterium]
MDDKLSARAKLIYERDNNSPLFLRTAEYYLQIGEPQTALTILENGIKIFSEHPLAFIMLAKVFLKLGDIQKAEAYFKKSSEVLDNHLTFEHYKSEFKLSNKPSSPFDTSRGSIFINQNDDDDEYEERINKNTDSVDDRLSEIADELMNRKIDRSEDTSFTPSAINEIAPDKTKLATETFANIYLSQGQKLEAIKIYELLIQRFPDKKEYYEAKIQEIKSQ